MPAHCVLGVEVLDSPQPTLTTLVRASRHELARALEEAFAGLERRSAGRKVVALHKFDREGAELAACLIVSAPTRGDELAELPRGRYLTLASATDARSLASVLPHMRDWLGEHRERAVGPVLVALRDERVIARQRIIGGSLGTQPVPHCEDALSALLSAVR